MFTFGTVYLKIPFEIELNYWKKHPSLGALLNL